jgi:hypothetical protein
MHLASPKIVKRYVKHFVSRMKTARKARDDITRLLSRKGSPFPLFRVQHNLVALRFATYQADLV